MHTSVSVELIALKTYHLVNFPVPPLLIDVLGSECLSLAYVLIIMEIK